MKKWLGSFVGSAALFVTISGFAQTPTPTPPVAGNDRAQLGSRQSIKIPVLANDLDDSGTVKLKSVGTPRFGTTKLVADQAPGAGTDPKFVVYTAGPAFPGFDRFEYTIEDNNGATATATVTISGLFAYSGLLGANITDSEGRPVGHLRLETMRTGVFTGKVTIGTKVYSLLGQLDRSGRYVGYARAEDGKTLALSLVVTNKSGVAQITGTFGGTNEWKISQAIDALSADGLEKLAGRYTVELPAVENPSDSGDDENDGGRAPQGAGWMTIEVNEFGNARLKGETGDGREFSASAQVVGSDSAPLLPFVAAWDASLLGGTLTLGDLVEGSLIWTRGKTDDDVFPDGFDLTVAAHGGRYTEREDRDRTLRNDSSDAGRATLTISGGGTPEITRELRFSESDDVSVLDEGDDRVNIEIDRTSGTFKGTFRDPDDLETRISFRGVLLQGEGRGAGVFQTETKSGLVELEVKTSDDEDEDDDGGNEIDF